MITLITGTPGAGKTLYALAEVYQQFAGRAVYVDGIPDLQLDHEQPLGPVEDAQTGASYADWLPEGAVLIVDECQRIWRPRAANSKVPDGVRAMETHRHHGHDLVLITQHPNLLDGNVRRLIGRHLHVRRVWGWNRALVYEWDQASDPNRVSTATKSSWAYPKTAFGLYKSASVHTARGQRPPWLLYMIFIAPIVVVLIGYQVYASIRARTTPQISPAGLASAAQPAQTGLTHGVARPVFDPREPGRPDTAPAYDALLQQVRAVPTPAACIASATRCQCYTSQATSYQIPEAECREIVRLGRYDPYYQPPPPTITPTPVQLAKPDDQPGHADEPLPRWDNAQPGQPGMPWGLSHNAT